MLYRAIGLMSGSSLDGLDIAFVEFHENGGKWSFEIMDADCYAYTEQWQNRLRDAIQLSAKDYLLLHAEYGHYIGNAVNRFISEKGLQYKVALVASHGHTSFHMPSQKMTAQLGDGAAIAAVTQLPVVSDLRAMDVAAGGQGAPIVPVGEKLLLHDYGYYLNLGGIANISLNAGSFIAYDVCAANRVLNLLAADAGKPYDEGGKLAASGTLSPGLLANLDQLDYYHQPFPKSLANDFGTDVVYPMILKAGITTADALHTYCVHIATVIARAIAGLKRDDVSPRMLVTGGGAHNDFLVATLRKALEPLQVELVIPDKKLVDYKEAVIMALIGVLRWREETNVFSTVTGSSRDTVGGALWLPANE